MLSAVDLDAVAAAWREDGFSILPGYLPTDELAAAQRELGTMFPSAAGFHDGSDPRRARFLGDEFAGIDSFPFASVEVSLLAVADRLVRLAEHLLDTTDLRLYSAETWAKYTGAADYEQVLHRDYLNHTLLVPTATPQFQQLELFVYLVDVPDELGPPHFVSNALTRELPAKPNWYPRYDLDDREDGFVSTGRPDLYDAEVSASGPAGTVVAFQPGTLHRGTALLATHGARYTMHLNYRPAAAEWAQRHAWADRSHNAAWYQFVGLATPRQLTLFGFPPKNHPYWTPETFAGIAQRYPNLDLGRWQS